MRVDLIRLLFGEGLGVLVRDLMGKFAKLREKEDSIGEVKTLRMQDKKEVTAAIEKIRDIQKRKDMQGWHNEARNSCISQSNKLTSPHRFHHRKLVVVALTALKHALISLPPLDFDLWKNNLTVDVNNIT